MMKLHTHWPKILRALLIGTIAAILCLAIRLFVGGGGWDLTWALAGARLLAQGQNPYLDQNTMLQLPLFYPLPALLIVWPLSLLNNELGSTLFVFFSVVVLAWAVQTKRPNAWPLFFSAPFIIAVLWAQWAPLLCAAVLLPNLFPLILAKPNLGLPILLLRRPSTVALLFSAILVLISFVLLPTWPLDWLHNMASHDNAIALLSLPGALLLLALLRWRDPYARLLIGLALVPLRFYDVLLLWLIPERTLDGVLLSLLSWIVCGPWLVRVFTGQGFVGDQPSALSVVGLLFLPTLAMLLVTQTGTRLQNSTVNPALGTAESM